MMIKWKNYTKFYEQEYYFFTIPLYYYISTLFILNLKKSASKRTSHKIISKDFASFN